MNPTATIKLFLPMGNPQRLRTAEISNWSGKAIAAPKTDIKELLAREELSKAGIYFLIGKDSSDNSPIIYIGEGEVVSERIKKHINREFWNSAIVFVSKDDSLTKAHIRYLEGKLIETATKISKCKVENSQGSGSRLPESDQHEMEVFLDRITQLLPILGSEILTPIEKLDQSNPNSETLTCKKKEAIAYGRRVPNGFVVFAGSTAALQARDSAKTHGQWVLALREKLIGNGTLIEKNDHYIFSRDSEFSSPSAAAAVIFGGNAAGPLAWKDKEGKTLKELEEQI